jgi:CheY-like chemotaxis protein
MTNSGNKPDVILVVDDDVLLRMYASGLLEDAGYSVVEAQSASEALEILEDRPDVRLLFTDIQMPPGVDGVELAREVHGRWPNILLLVTSGGLSIADEDLPDHGRFQTKPYREDMVEKVKDLVATRDAKPPS